MKLLNTVIDIDVSGIYWNLSNIIYWNLSNIKDVEEELWVSEVAEIFFNTQQSMADDIFNTYNL